MGSFRDSILAISPPWLTNTVAGGIQYAEGLIIDVLAEWARQGVRASMPGYGTPDALYLVGRDMQIDRGPHETDTHYATRLQKAIDTWATAGAAPTLLRQLAAYFSPNTYTPVRLVSNSAVWHEYNYATDVVTQTNVGTNWNWDGRARWWRGWVIIDSSTGPWAADLWDEVAPWGDGGAWGSTATLGEVAALQNIVAKWAPANVATEIIVTFAATNFERTDASPPNPSGTSNTSLWRTGYSASFWGKL